MTTSKDNLELGQFIPLHYHYNMLSDNVRMTSFKEALDYAVRPGARVLEFGGGTGVLSFFAAKNASKVWCVEKNPELANEARRILALNPFADKIEIVEADAMQYLPPEPVDVVICEMLHVGMLREKQIAVISSFKERYVDKFNCRLPVFVPEALLQAVQPIQQNFDFYGFYAPTFLFQDPVVIQSRTQELGDPAVYQMTTYEETLPDLISWDGILQINGAGSLNAVRFITKNILAVVVKENRTVDWRMQYLIIPLRKSIAVKKDDKVRIRFSYKPGCSLNALADVLEVGLA
ncbi:MAG: methyltransferase type 12 [Nitrospinae bacterium RIFCSPLOWO2_12_FULL_47_7]|nr:MAG: methyltransferase type 12 [Nitrospinae bacterium RIFCSPLOWO2_12_FULL_47_7]